MDTLELLSQLSYAEPPDPTVLAAATAAVAAAETSSAHHNRRHRPTARKSTRARRSVALAVTAAAAVTGLSLAAVSTIGGTPTASAAEFLRTVARTAAVQPGGWPHAAYWYSESEYWQLDSHGVRTATKTRQVWIGHDGKGLIEDPSAGGSLPLTGHDDQDNPAANTSGFGGYQQWSWDYLYQVSDNPTTLLAALTAAVRPEAATNHANINAYIFDDITSLLTESPAPPALRSALYQVAAGLPGATLHGDVTDSLGRHGTAVEYPATNGWGTTRLIIDPANGQLLEQQNLAPSRPNPFGPAGTVYYMSTWPVEGPATTVGIVPTGQP